MSKPTKEPTREPEAAAETEEVVEETPISEEPGKATGAEPQDPPSETPEEEEAPEPGETNPDEEASALAEPDAEEPSRLEESPSTDDPPTGGEGEGNGSDPAGEPGEDAPPDNAEEEDASTPSPAGSADEGEGEDPPAKSNGRHATLFPAYPSGPPTHLQGKRSGGPMNFKAIPGIVKEVNGRTVTGLFNVFGVLDAQRDILHPGSFSKTFSERKGKILHLWQHDFWSPPTAVVRDLYEIDKDDIPEEILEEFPEATGGAVVVREYLDTPRGNESLAAIQAGSPLQMSFGFDLIRYEVEEDDELGRIRHVREVRLWETSDVLWGANDATRASKSAALATPFETLVWQITEHLQHMTKEGRRNSEADQTRINTIAKLALELGADNVVPAEQSGSDEEDDDKSVSNDDHPTQRRAGAESAPPLTLLEAELSLLELEMFTE